MTGMSHGEALDELILTYLLDTNVISELRKIGDGKVDANVVARVGREDSASFFISAITILELERGILGVQLRDPRQGARLRTWLDNHLRPDSAYSWVTVATRNVKDFEGQGAIIVDPWLG